MKNHYTDLKIVAFFSGAVIMVLEILGFRILAPYFGYSVYVSGSLIGIVMVALSLGYYLGGHLADRKPEKFVLFVLILIADIYLILLSFFYTELIEYLSKLGVIYGSIVSSIVLFAPSMIFLAMVPPFIIRLMTRDTSVAGSVAGDITAIGTIGSIIGTFGATFVLIPKIGSHWTMYLCSILLLLVSVYGLIIRRKSFVLLLLLAFAFNMFPNEIESNIIFKKESPYNLVKVIQREGGKLSLILNSNRGTQSVYDPESELVNNYYDFLNIAPMIAGGEEILILGMGAGTSAKQFLYYFNVNIDAVEIDPLVIYAGKEYFGIKESERLRIYTEDARPFLRGTNKNYDVIEVDVYHGGVYAPFYVLTKEFFQSVYDHLNPNGVMVINVLSPYQAKKRTLLVDSVGNTMSRVFPSIYKIEGHSNHLLFATKSDTDIGMIRRRLFFYEGHIDMQRIAFRAASRSLSEFYIKNDAPVLTDDKAPVARITYEMISGSGNNTY